mgnify:CR=1 FL=1
MDTDCEKGVVNCAGTTLYLVAQTKEMDKNHVVRIKCSDRKGLIAGISGVMHRNDHNILVMKEFVEQETGMFFLRLEVSGTLNAPVLEAALKEVLPREAQISIIPRKLKNIVIMVTREHHCLSDLLVRCAQHPAAAGETFLVSDGEDLSTPGLIRQLARAMGRTARLAPVPVGLLRLGGRLTGRSGEVARLVDSLQVDVTPTRATLDWTPPLSMLEGLQKMTQGSKP